MRIRDLVSLVFALAFCCASIFGQTVASSMVGSVVDPADAAVAGAQVALTNTGTGAVHQATTDNVGSYRFVELDPGPSTLTIKATGFKTETVNGIQVAMQEVHNRSEERRVGKECRDRWW